MRCHPILKLLPFLLWFAWPLAAGAETVVIVHPSNPVHSMTPREVSDLYLGRSRNFATGAQTESLPAFIYEYSADSPLREKFFRALNSMSISKLNAYWARLRFSGEVLPPLALADSSAVLNAVSQNQKAIGYVEASAVTDASVKIVLRLKE